MLLRRVTLGGLKSASGSPDGGGALRRIINSAEKSDGRAFTVRMTFRRFAEPYRQEGKYHEYDESSGVDEFLTYICHCQSRGKA